jgi:hypothetical protein
MCYAKYCFDAASGTGHYLPHDLCVIIRDELVAIFALLQRGETAVDLRRKHLRATAPLWTPLKSTRSCLPCLQRGPEHVLVCGHAICDACVPKFGTVHPEGEYRFRVSSCVLCLARTDLLVRLKPPTARPCVLSIDGGGVRGVVALTFLSALQEELGTCYPLQEYFDSAIGTSSGRIEILMLSVLVTDPSV